MLISNSGIFGLSVRWTVVLLESLKEFYLSPHLPLNTDQS